MPTEYELKKLKDDSALKICKFCYENESMDPVTGSIVDVRAVSD